MVEGAARPFARTFQDESPSGDIDHTITTKSFSFLANIYLLYPVRYV
jgi:hypothetical protein